ncbi:DUF2284 domain-containing protein [Desulfogranum japonicum]|uniref:DUF2284 domain-containing protein n=1 Tax=Desulfogranum japonicum TaxID=231447 RepID=UPI00041BC6CB|nr:DUF2284 domain-containing protein [Desulfogranum japonicum]
MTQLLHPADPAQIDFQFFEDLSTAYWYSQIFFTALELKIFEHIENGSDTVEKLAQATSSEPEMLSRMLRVLISLHIIGSYEGCLYTSQATSKFLIPGKTDYMGDFFLYRQYMAANWQNLRETISSQPKKVEEELTYEERNFRYVAAMDTLIRQKAPQIARLIDNEKITGSMLDIGGGSGTICRAILATTSIERAYLCDLPEVIEAAHRIFPQDCSWENIETISGDFRSHDFDRQFNLVCMSNFLHAYSAEDARPLFAKAVSLLQPEGLLLIHDYFPDRPGSVPHKGALYDVNMMLNTFNGTCHDTETLLHWLQEEGLDNVGVKDLQTDTGIIMAKRAGSLNMQQDPLIAAALQLDLLSVVPISPAEVVTAPWPRQKCRFGCEEFNKGLQCPPYGMEHDKTRELLDSYSRAYLVRGTPPGKSFHNTLLSLEKHAFLQGYHKAFSFSAGPCNLCPSCPEDNQCRLPHLARPSMEGSGIDVYATAENAGITLQPVQKKGQYVTYIGLILME